MVSGRRDFKLLAKEGCVVSIKLGDLVRDRVTGYTGIVVGITEWLYGGRQIGVQSRYLLGAKPQDPVWFDEGRITDCPEDDPQRPRKKVV